MIHELGCGYYERLVITGQARGQVWTDMRACDSGLFPNGDFAIWLRTPRSGLPHVPTPTETGWPGPAGQMRTFSSWAVSSSLRWSAAGHDDAMSKHRFLVSHDYGMGGLWWWIHARSTREVLETFAEVEVVDTPAVIVQAEGWGLDDVDIDAPVMPAGLDGLRATREGQRGLPGFGAFAGRQVVYLRQKDEDDPATYLTEIGSDGRRVRQVEVSEDRTAIKTDTDDWPFNPPVDLFDPQLPEQEIDRDTFEQAWRVARWEDETRRR